MKYLLLLLLMVTAGPIRGQTLPPKQAYPLDIRQIHSGHSLTDPLFGQPWPGQYVNLITQLRGIWALDDIGKSTIPGSPLFWRWENEASHPVSPKARHDIQDWGLLVITEGIPIPNDGGNPPLITPANEYLSRYVNNAWEVGNHGQGAATLLWTTWTNLDGAEGPWRATLDSYENHWEAMQDYANAHRPDGAPPVYLIPGHRMMARIYDDITLQLVPGITAINQFFSDQIHTNSLGDYAIALIHYACIFNQSPVGLPHDLMPNPPPGFQMPSPALAAYLQQMVWEVVTAYPRTGISDPVSGTDDPAFAPGAVQIYPNPFRDVLYIADKNPSRKAQRTIRDLLGRVVYQGMANEINLGHLPVGFYIFSLGDEHLQLIKK